MNPKSLRKQLSDGFARLGAAQKIPANDNVIEALISGNPALEAAVADLVDNSIDAGARHIEIRFHRSELSQTVHGAPVSLSVWDDGSGMNRDALIEAVKLSSPERRLNGELGKFGVGLKAASFAKSTETSIFSKGPGGEIFGMELSGPVGDRKFELLAEESFGSGFSRSHATIPNVTGTIVRWESLRGVPKFESAIEVRKYVQEQSENLTRYLGVVFHKFLDDEVNSKIEIKIMQVDSLGGQGIPTTVRPLSPIHSDENVNSTCKYFAVYEDRSLPITVQISPKGVSFPDLSLVSGSPNGSGIYIYRNNRIIQLGGWEGLLAVGTHDYRLMRVAIDIPTALEESGDFSVAHQKNGCVFSDELRDAILEAETAQDQSSIRHFAHVAETRQKQSVPREIRPTAMVRIAEGLPQALVDYIHENCQTVASPVEVHRVKFPAGSTNVFQLELQDRKLLVNGDMLAHLNLEQEVVASLIFLTCRKWLEKESLSEQDARDVATINDLVRLSLEKGSPQV
jgi:hypothetical protein